MGRTWRLSQAALEALNQMVRQFQFPLGPGLLEEALAKLRHLERRTVGQILLRRELERMPPEARKSLSCTISAALGGSNRSDP